MTTDSQAPQFDVQPLRHRRPTRALRRLGLATAGLSIAILGAGHAAAAPAPLHQAVAGCGAPVDGQPNGKQFPGEPPLSIDPGSGYSATLQTNCGPITVSLDAANAPHTVNSFVFLAGQQYFDHSRCHRLTTAGIFVLQCGDPTGTGHGGPGYRFQDENLAGAVYPAGTLAMANSGPNSNGSQFFLVYKDSQLPANYTPFGRVTGGMDVLQNIAGGGTADGSPDGAPAAGVVLDSVAADQN
ncbi:peptidylprolyl isomerase [Nocardia sp. BMG111209]|uniref:peptidylprolyl isomerase n=1 Tax=Nocardia sp. BMG111209 TaxID=1160137 RepID=UPI000372AB5B|nr:peptidylprolyl isomerase [Nocardia sp. BMG111209]